MCKTRVSDAHKTAKEVVTRLYKPVDVADLKRLQKKYNTIDATAKDSCFYFAVVDKNGKHLKMLDSYNDEVDKKKHFSFELDGSLMVVNIITTTICLCLVSWGDESQWLKSWYWNRAKRQPKQSSSLNN